MAGFLELLEPPERDALQALAVSRSCPHGTPLYRCGDDAGPLYVLLRGWVKIGLPGPDGRDVLLGLHGRGAVLGELSALGGAPRAATVTAVEDVEALAVPGPALRALVARRPRIALVLLDVLGNRLRALDRRYVELAAVDVLGRVASRLGELAAAAGRPAVDGVEISLPLTQEELASLTGASREAVSRALGTLRRLGCVTIERRHITVLDSTRLAGHAPHAFAWGAGEENAHALDSGSPRR